jgi:hypothetical protein
VKLTDHSLPFGAKVKSEWSYVSSLPYSFMAHMGETLDSVISLVTSLQVGRCGVQILAELVGFSGGPNVGAHPAS